MRIVIATGNPHKVDEIRAVLEPMGFAVVSLPELGRPVPAEPDEPGSTFEENARIKARYYAAALGERCLPMTADWKWTRSKERPASTVRTGLAPKVPARTAMRATTRSWWV